MGIYLFWGEDEFRLNRAVMELRDRSLDPDWISFNYDKLPPDQADAVPQGLNQAMTPPFGLGQRFVWIAETSVFQRCPEACLKELERSLPVVPETTILVFTSSTKPDGRLKSTKLVQQLGEVREFGTIPPWKTDQLVQQVKLAAREVGVQLTNGATQLLAESVGNQSRQLFNELGKLHLYASSVQHPVDEAMVTRLVTASTQNSLQLATAIRQGETAKALTLVSDLFNRNEPALRIVATLVGQFRLWLWVKLMVETGERNEQDIARAAEVSNPKRIYFLQQEVRPVSLKSLQNTLIVLLELESGLKQGADPLVFLQSKVIELCQLFCRKSAT
jgi:DNA polymerase-3 subunit delta